MKKSNFNNLWVFPSLNLSFIRTWVKWQSLNFTWTTHIVNSMVLCVLSPQLQKCSESCAYVQQASLKNLSKTPLHKHLPLHNCILFSLTIVALWYTYIHLLTSSSSENLHELLSSVIILERVQIAESASMSCTVSCATWNTGTLSSGTGSEIERLCQKLFSCWNEMRYSLIYNKVHTAKLNLELQLVWWFIIMGRAWASSTLIY